MSVATRLITAGLSDWVMLSSYLIFEAQRAKTLLHFSWANLFHNQLLNKLEKMVTKHPNKVPKIPKNMSLRHITIRGDFRRLFPRVGEPVHETVKITRGSSIMDVRLQLHMAYDEEGNPSHIIVQAHPRTEIGKTIRDFKLRSKTTGKIILPKEVKRRIGKLCDSKFGSKRLPIIYALGPHGD